MSLYSITYSMMRKMLYACLYFMTFCVLNYANMCVYTFRCIRFTEGYSSRQHQLFHWSADQKSWCSKEVHIHHISMHIRRCSQLYYNSTYLMVTWWAIQIDPLKQLAYSLYTCMQCSRWICSPSGAGCGLESLVSLGLKCNTFFGSRQLELQVLLAIICADDLNVAQRVQVVLYHSGRPGQNASCMVTSQSALSVPVTVCNVTS